MGNGSLVYLRIVPQLPSRDIGFDMDTGHSAHYTHRVPL